MQKKEAKRTLPHSDLFSKNRKGQGLSTSAIVLIILGVAILVFLIIGFTMGWSRILPWLGSNNVDAIVEQCNTACLSGGKYAFCSQQRELRADEGVKVTETCEKFSTNLDYDLYGIDECDSITCVEETESCNAKVPADATECEALTTEVTCTENAKCVWQ